MAYVGGAFGASLGRAFFPALRPEGGEATLQFHIVDKWFPEGSGIGVVFLDGEEVAGAVLSPSLEPFVPFEIPDASIPESAASAAAFALPVDATVAARIDILNTTGGFGRFYLDYLSGKLSGASPRNLLGYMKGVCVRSGPSPDGNGGTVTSAYEGLLGGINDRLDDRYEGYTLHVPLVLTGDGFDSLLYIQNSYPHETAAEIVFRKAAEPRSAPTLKNHKTPSGIDKIL